MPSGYGGIAPGGHLRNRLQRLWPILLVVAALVGCYAAGLFHLLSLDALSRRQQALRGFALGHPFEAIAAYVALYAAIAAIAVPGGAVLTVAGGLPFGTWLGAAAAVAGATTGATLLFLAARHALADWLAERAGGLLDRIRPSLERDGIGALLALRLMPVVPFWLVNLGAGLIGVPLRRFILTTLFGIVPGTTVFASVGAGIGGVLDAGRSPDLEALLRPAILPLVGLSLLSLLPMAWRRLRGAAA